MKLTVEQALFKANSHIKNGELDQARVLYKAVLKASPDNMRAKVALSSLDKAKMSAEAETKNPCKEKLDQLIALYSTGLSHEVILEGRALAEQFPSSFVLWNILGAAYQALGQSNNAIAAYERSLDLNPNYASAYNNMGNSLRDQGKHEDAIAAYQRALNLKPDYASPYNNMGNALRDQGKLEDAIAAYRRALALRPDYAEALNNMGSVLHEQGNLEEALNVYERALGIKPNYAGAYNNMGNALRDQGKHEDAVAAYQRALVLKPDYADAINNMGTALREQGKLKDAIVAHERALELKPDYAEAHNNLGVALHEQGNFDGAMAAYERALNLKPDYADALNNMGSALRELGNADGAIKFYNKALSVKPEHVVAHRHLSLLKEYKAEDLQVATVIKMMQRSDLIDSDRCHLYYTLAKMNEDLGYLEAAFDNYVAGGKLMQKLLRYNFKYDETLFNQIKSTAPKIHHTPIDFSIEPTKKMPIFIVGMPRSGTTLVEQIISCHSKVYGAGELSFLSIFGGQLSAGMNIVNSESVFKLRTEYLNVLEKISNDCPFVIDKMPHNFMHIALILKAMPEAKIIHVKRDPAATCWSNFKQFFSVKGLGYSYDLKDTVKYFRLYQDLMQFWDHEYENQIYHLDYEELTCAQEVQTRKLIHYLGLPWEDACLSPQKNTRRVKTASSQQVRKQVYAGSSQNWRKFEKYLNGVFDELVK